MQEPLRLAFIGDPNNLHTRRWLGFFAGRGHRVHLLEPYGVEIRPGLPDGVEVLRYRAFGRRRVRLLSLLQGRAALRRVLAEIRPHVLHAHFVTRYAWQARLSGFHPYVVSPWGSDLFVTPRQSLRARLWARLALRGADLVTVLTEPMREAVVRLGAAPRRVVTVQFGVDTGRFSPGPPDPGVAGRLGLGDRPIVFAPRALRPLYRHETLLDALVRLGDPCPATVVMSARFADPGYLAALRQRAERNGVADRLRILDDIAEADLVELYRLAAVVVSVPESDGFPSTVLEAMACGVPVVVSDLPAIRTVVGRFTPELIVPVGDAEALAAALRRSLALTARERLELGERLRGHVVAEADHETNMLKMERLYRRLAGQA